MANGITWPHRAGIGALGGLSLGLLKLIDARFFLANLSSTEALASYLTYFCYLFFGSLVAVVFTDPDLPPAKIRKNAFVLGLLAPSLLLAILNQPIKGRQIPDEGIMNVPKIGGWLIPSAHAQEQSTPRGASETEQPKIVTLKKNQVEPSFGDALWSALGRRDIVTPYFYVVGTTMDKEKALKAAETVNRLLSPETADKLKAQVVKPEGVASYYVTVGNLGTPYKAYETKSAAMAAASKALTAKPSSESKEAASLLLEGKVVKGQSFFHSFGKPLEGTPLNKPYETPPFGKPLE